MPLLVAPAVAPGTLARLPQPDIDADGWHDMHLHARLRTDGPPPRT
ncbi:hypothetical protein [Micromonospora citrea]|nr:hypothetical protein [Micromonospora citrea]